MAGVQSKFELRAPPPAKETAIQRWILRALAFDRRIVVLDLSGVGNGPRGMTKSQRSNHRNRQIAHLYEVSLRRLAAVDGPAILVWRQNTGGMKDHRGQFVRFNLPGTPDLGGILRTSWGAYPISVEVKRPTGKPSKIQIARALLFSSMGEITLLAHSSEEAVERVGAILAAASEGRDALALLTAAA